MSETAQSILVVLVAAIVVFGSCFLSYKMGEVDMKQNIITYCKADGVYLTEGTMLQCNVMTSKRGTAT